MLLPSNAGKMFGKYSAAFYTSTSGRSCNVLDLSVRLFVCYKSCERDILKANEPISMQIGTQAIEILAKNNAFKQLRKQELVYFCAM